jgi:hypothetical protein
LLEQFKAMRTKSKWEEIIKVGTIMKKGTKMKMRTI